VLSACCRLDPSNLPIVFLPGILFTWVASRHVRIWQLCVEARTRVYGFIKF
jgi:hypothetical protein